MLEAAEQNREDVEEVQDRLVSTVLASGSLRLPGPEKAVSTAFQVLLSPLHLELTVYRSHYLKLIITRRCSISIVPLIVIYLPTIPVALR